MAVGHDRETNDGKWFKEQMKELEKLEVRVGYQQGENTDKETGADLADIAMWNEYGTEYVPPRPFLRQSVDNYASQISAMCKAQLQAIASKRSTAEQALNALGNMQRGLVQDEILDGEFVPNAPATVRNKKSDTPLIDTGNMRQKVNFVIVPKGRD